MFSFNQQQKWENNNVKRKKQSMRGNPKKDTRKEKYTHKYRLMRRPESRSAPPARRCFVPGAARELPFHGNERSNLYTNLRVCHFASARYERYIHGIGERSPSK